jgi:hypothetical protein
MQVDTIPLKGGVDTETTPGQVTPGKLISALNYEPSINGGYSRIGGIERVDGQTRPSEGNYYVMEVTTTGIFSVGDTITGVTSGETAKIISVTSSTEIVVTLVSGTFTVSETLNVSGLPQGTHVSSALNAGTTALLHSQYKNAAADEYRALISAPAGSGPVRGVWYYNGNRYCFRDNAGATACVMFKESTSGWTPISFGEELQFDNAVGEIFEGDTVTGLSSGANGVVKRALLRTGTWTSAGVGTLVFDSVAGGPFTDNEALQVSAATKADADGVENDITLQPGGRFEFDNGNLSGNPANYRMYCADGVNYIGEFDGTRWVPIRTGIQDDAPEYIKIHRNHLFALFGPSLQHSSIGDQYAWTALTGANELALGEDGTGLQVQVGDASTGVLAISTANKIYLLFGTSTSDFSLSEHSPKTGAKHYTMQNIGSAYFWDTKGLNQLAAAQEFGGFQMSTLSKQMQKYVNNQQGLEVASCVVQAKNQYRIFFSDGRCLVAYFYPGRNGMEASLMPLKYSDDFYMNQVCVYTDSAGKERILGAGSNGMVYELDVGTSIDGEDIPAHIMMTFIHSGNMRVRKRYRRAVLQMAGGTTARISVGYDLSFGGSYPSQGRVASSIETGGGGYWDSFVFGDFFWDGAYVQEVNVPTKGNGESISVLITGETDMDEPYTIHTALIHFIQGRYSR